MKSKTKNYITLGPYGLPALLILGLAGSGCTTTSAEPAPTELSKSQRAARVVELGTVEEGPLVRERRFSGVVRAANRAQLTFTLSGRVNARPAEIGQMVGKGDILAVLDRRPLRNALAAARANRQTIATRIEQSNRDTVRAQTLRDANAIGAEELERTRSGLDSLTAQLAAASAQVAEASRQLEEATLRAPFAGTVVNVFVEPGEFAQAGRPAVLLSGENRTEVEIEVPDRMRRLLSVGTSATISFPLSRAQPTKAQIDRLGRASAGAGRLLPVVLRLAKDSEAIAGQTAEVLLTTTDQSAVTIPVSSVVDPSGSRPSVFRVTDDTASLVNVELGEIVGDRVAVVNGIAVGDVIVRGGHANLVSGEQVIAANATNSKDTTKPTPTSASEAVDE